MTYLSRACLGFLLLITFNSYADSITVSNAWLRAAPPIAPALAAFMTLSNSSNSEISLIKAKVDFGSEAVELHRTQMQNGMMKMIPQPFIPVPAKGKTQLQPGSWHIMIIKPESVPKMGKTVKITLSFSDGSVQTVSAPVKKGNMMKHNMMH